MIRLHFFTYPIIDNGLLLGLATIIRRLFNILYNFIFYRRKNIRADYTSAFQGIRYMTVGNVMFGRYCRVELVSRYNSNDYHPRLKIGNRVVINDMVHIGCVNYIEIGDDCLFASRIYISDHNHGLYSGFKQSYSYELVSKRCLDTDSSVIIGNNVWLGEGVVVLPGSRIGDNSIVGANAVVCGEIPSNSIAVGIPARVIKKYDLESKQWVPY